MTGGQEGEEVGPRCTCWVIIRGDRARPDGWEGDEYEITPDPDCPIHGRRRKVHPFLEDPEEGPDPES